MAITFDDIAYTERYRNADDETKRRVASGWFEDEMAKDPRWANLDESSQIEARKRFLADYDLYQPKSFWQNTLDEGIETYAPIIDTDDEGGVGANTVGGLAGGYGRTLTGAAIGGRLGATLGPWGAAGGALIGGGIAAGAGGYGKTLRDYEDEGVDIGLKEHLTAVAMGGIDALSGLVTGPLGRLALKSGVRPSLAMGVEALAEGGVNAGADVLKSTLDEKPIDTTSLLVSAATGVGGHLALPTVSKLLNYSLNKRAEKDVRKAEAESARMVEQGLLLEDNIAPANIQPGQLMNVNPTQRAIQEGGGLPLEVDGNLTGGMGYNTTTTARLSNPDGSETISTLDGDDTAFRNELQQQFSNTAQAPKPQAVDLNALAQRMEELKALKAQGRKEEVSYSLDQLRKQRKAIANTNPELAMTLTRMIDDVNQVQAPKAQRGGGGGGINVMNVPQNTTTALSPSAGVKVATQRPISQGKAGQAYDSDGNAYEFTYTLAELDDLVPSNLDDFSPNPNYPKELQPRDRTRAASQVQVGNIANRLVPAMLGESNNISEGAPIVGRDLAVESGNGRTMALRQAYQQNPENAQAYRNYLMEKAEGLGLNPQAIEGMNKPALVRMRTSDVDRVAFAKRANQSGVQSMSALEQAQNDASKLDDTLLNSLNPKESGDLNDDFIFEFISTVPENERSSMVSGDGKLTSTGLKRIENAILAKSIGDNEGKLAIANMLDSVEESNKSLGKAIVNTAPTMVATKNAIQQGQLKPLDISGDVGKAASTYLEIKRNGQNVDEYHAQGRLFDDGLNRTQHYLLQAFDAFKRQPRRLEGVLKQYYDKVREQGDPRQTSLFPIADKTPAQLLKEVLEEGDEGLTLRDIGEDTPGKMTERLDVGSDKNASDQVEKQEVGNGNTIGSPFSTIPQAFSSDKDVVGFVPEGLLEGFESAPIRLSESKKKHIQNRHPKEVAEYGSVEAYTKAILENLNEIKQGNKNQFIGLAPLDDTHMMVSTFIKNKGKYVIDTAYKLINTSKVNNKKTLWSRGSNQLSSMRGEDSINPARGEDTQPDTRGANQTEASDDSIANPDTPTQGVEDLGGSSVAFNQASALEHINGRAQEIGFDGATQAAKAYKYIGSHLNPGKEKMAEINEDPLKRTIFDKLKQLSSEYDPTGEPKYPIERERDQAMLEILRTTFDESTGLGLQRNVSELKQVTPNNHFTLDEIKKSTAWGWLKPEQRRWAELIGKMIEDDQAMKVFNATEGGQGGVGGATNAIKGIERDRVTPLSFTLEKGEQIAILAYNSDGHISKYYLQLDPRLSPDQEASRLLKAPRVSTAPPYRGTYPNIHKGPLEYRLEDVMNRKPREEGMRSSEAQATYNGVQNNKHLFSEKALNELNLNPNIANLRKASHELLKASKDENVVKWLERIQTQAGKQGKVSEGQLIRLKKALEKDPSLKNIDKLCKMFKLDTKGLK
jgi:hypothetical protein